MQIGQYFKGEPDSHRVQTTLLLVLNIYTICGLKVNDVMKDFNTVEM